MKTLDNMTKKKDFPLQTTPLPLKPSLGQITNTIPIKSSWTGELRSIIEIPYSALRLGKLNAAYAEIVNY